ncbi:hypothetical protein PPERSA_09067 [Pseudocohnilembus persalinus]|uniref:Uncharacterized protein n=1 Tax=Pseudocohnilembus persalinus TaxID=266149 RepID=A0A0V0QLK8_PSEPJ|nr:hypothetical protein PPERSA_09067 [Pseudocohnilembus persalinus]|eukprot:KRX02945.1 hypothetical protein PPERSA_09067 [Pseudocohnilembus persalinus]
MSLGALKNHFLKSRVLSLSYHIEPTMAQLSKSYLENPDEYFLSVDHGKYYELKFYSQIAQSWKINPAYFSQQELAKYEETVKKMQEFNEFQALINQLHLFFWECKSLYIDVSRDQATSNLWGRATEQSHLFEEKITAAMKKYDNLLEQTADYPDWQEKIKGEIGGQIHLIYTALQTGENFQEIFKDFDKAYFFK